MGHWQPPLRRLVPGGRADRLRAAGGSGRVGGGLEGLRLVGSGWRFGKRHGGGRWVLVGWGVGRVRAARIDSQSGSAVAAVISFYSAAGLVA